MPKLILIVDNDPHFRLFAEKALVACGYVVETRDNAFGLINRVIGFDEGGKETRAPHAVIIDHMMPGLEGADSIRLLAKHPVARGVPVLLCSAGEPAILKAAVAAHPRCRFVPKTGHMADVVEAVGELIAERAAPAESAG